MEKGVESLIATILLVGIGFTLLIISHYWITSFTEEIISKQKLTTIKEFYLLGTKIIIDDIGYCKIYLRNVGAKDIPLKWMSFYINDMPINWTSSEDTLKKGEVVEIDLNPDFIIGGEGDLSVQLESNIIDLGKIICPFPVSCSIKNSCDIGEECIIGLSSTTNAHVENCSGNYPYKLCCSVCCTDVSVNYTSSPCPTGEGIISLHNDTNTQVQEYNLPTGFAVKKNVCLNSEEGILECMINTTINCLNHKYGLMFSISSQTNAHVGNYSSYDKVICCRII
jgi:hypothetical protein